MPATLQAGRWSPASHAAPVLDAAQLEALERLQAIGYAAGSREAPTIQSVTRHDRQKAWQGLNFYTSGHGTEAILIDMDGHVLHRWSFDYEALWPELKVPQDALGRPNWRRAHLFPNGDILAIHEGIGMIKLDRDSNLLWEYPGRAHHDMHVAEDGTIYVLTRIARMATDIHPSEPILEDYIATLTPDGKELRRVSVLRSLVNAGKAELLERIGSRGGDLLHTNAVEILDGRLSDSLPGFAAGAALVSFRYIDAIAVIDIARARATWTLRGDFRAQHHPTVLDNGNILLFDNTGPGEGVSAVSEVEPATGEVVWEFYNPARAGDDGQYIATLFDLQRFGRDYGFDWLTAGR